MRQALTNTPTALANITAGTTYTVQNQSPHVLYMQVAAAAPMNAGEAFKIDPGKFGYPEASGGESIFVWVGTDLRIGAGAAVYDESS